MNELTEALIQAGFAVLLIMASMLVGALLFRWGVQDGANMISNEKAGLNPLHGEVEMEDFDVEDAQDGSGGSVRKRKF